MVLSHLNDQIEIALDILDALYFFLQSVPENQDRLNWIRQNFRRAPKRTRSGLLGEVRNEIKWLRDESGALASNSDFVDFFKEVRQAAAKGHIFIPKWEIERRWFSNFGRVIVRWPYMKGHAMLIYDPTNGQVRNQIFEIEGALFRDAEVLLNQAKSFHRRIEDFRERARDDQLLLHTYLRTAATVVFHYLESYLNGLAFDCLLRYDDKLSEADRDALKEWDRKNQRNSFVSVEKKIFRYPVIFGKYMGIKLDLSGCKPAYFLAKDAREIRNALTHPSPHLDPESQTLKKMTLITTVDLRTTENILLAVKEYTLTVENALFGKPEETAPWLFPKSAKPQEPTPLAGVSTT